MLNPDLVDEILRDLRMVLRHDDYESLSVVVRDLGALLARNMKPEKCPGGVVVVLEPDGGVFFGLATLSVAALALGIEAHRKEEKVS